MTLPYHPVRVDVRLQAMNMLRLWTKWSKNLVSKVFICISHVYVCRSKYLLSYFFSGNKLCSNIFQNVFLLSLWDDI